MSMMPKSNMIKRTVSGSSQDARTVELKKLMGRKLREEGWTTIKQFMKGTGVPYSPETVRRAFNDCDWKNIETSSLAIILKYLNCDPDEIRHILETYTDDKELSAIIGTSKLEYNIYERSLVDVYRSVTKIDPALSNVIADQLDLIGLVARVDTKKFTDALRR